MRSQSDVTDALADTVASVCLFLMYTTAMTVSPAASDPDSRTLVESQVLVAAQVALDVESTTVTKLAVVVAAALIVAEAST
jgi:hypothetical protein